MADLFKNNSVVLIYDEECFAAITHKYQLHPVGVFLNETGSFASAIIEDEELVKALDDYYDENHAFSVPLEGFVKHRIDCHEEFENIKDNFRNMGTVS